MVDVDSRAEINSTLLIVELIELLFSIWQNWIKNTYMEYNEKGFNQFLRTLLILDFKFKVFVDFTD